MKLLSELLQQDFVSFNEVEEHCDDHIDVGTAKKQAPADFSENDFLSFDKLGADLSRAFHDKTHVELSTRQNDPRSRPRTLNIQNYRGISGDMIISPYREALRYATQTSLATHLPKSQKTCVLWTNGSAGYHETMRASGAAVVYKRRQDSSVWMHGAYSIIPHCESYLAELIAIEKALGIALHMSKERSSCPQRRIIIFSDCRDALRDIAHDAVRGEIMRNFVKTSLVLYNLGVQLELRWVPGHAGIPGNMRADGMAKRARNRGSRWNSHAPKRPIGRFGDMTVYQMVA